ncbi:MAG: FHA domain-containing protein [Verrucomicrobia bacterium]|nr:FHA domain-containing protein [Verrucomicrobiota bacterium]
MVQFQILNGRQSGLNHFVNQFPATLGRSHSADICVEGDGIWDQHLEISLDPSHCFTVKTFPNCLASLNGQRFDQSPLRSGDTIEIGSVRMRFWLKQTRQPSLRPREIATWIGLGVLSLGQVALIYWLSR